ncbi:IS607 family transposase [Cupriavidus necator]|uniref:IS607 family transposase n=1 Tax=Cupriavidus necator TaxID=106590 RepID=UPI0005B34E43|nr:IS607 family transposase [Cupriavidus necator]
MSILAKVTMKEACAMLGIHPGTLRRWEFDGKISADRTPGGHRRYNLTALMELAGKKVEEAERGRTTLAYARVSSHDQKADLERQCQVLESFCAAKGWPFELIRDLGSGMNYEMKGLKQLLKRICAGGVDRLVITHKDRLLRFGAELVFALCEQFGTEVVIINAKGDSTYEEDLACDVLEIISVFSARLYGSRSHENRHAMKALKEAADAIQEG